MENDQGNSPADPTPDLTEGGMTKALTERAPMARKVRMALENMMMESVVREDR